MNKFKKAHSMAKTIKKLYPDVDYKFQFSICLKFLYGKPLPEGRKETVKPVENTIELRNGKITPESLLKELNQIKIKGVSLKFNWYKVRLTERVYILAWENGQRHEIGYIDYSKMEYKPTNRRNAAEVAFLVDHHVEQKLGEIAKEMPWKSMYA